MDRFPLGALDSAVVTDLTFTEAEDFFLFEPVAFNLGPVRGVEMPRPLPETAAAAAAALTTLCFRISLSGLSLNSVLLTPPLIPISPRLVTFVEGGGGIRGNMGLEKMAALSFGMGNFGAIRPPAAEHLDDWMIAPCTRLLMLSLPTQLSVWLM